MTPFKINTKSPLSIFDQVVYEATKAIIGGTLKPGDSFPSVRTLASDLKIHPNTAHKAIQHLIQERWLISIPGRGTIVAEPPSARSEERNRLLSNEVEALVVEAMRVGATLDEVTDSIREHWKSLKNIKAVSNDN